MTSNLPTRPGFGPPADDAPSDPIRLLELAQRADSALLRLVLCAALATMTISLAAALPNF